MRRTVGVTAAASATFLLLTAAAPGALAADTGVSVTDQETVQIHLDASGKQQDASVYDQIAAVGHGTVHIENPVSTKGLRNLDGFAGFKVKDGQIAQTITVDGQTRRRTMSDYTKTSPLKVTVTYKLNGKTVKPGSVVGKSGALVVNYHIENVTGKPTDLTYDDGTGKQVHSTQNVVIPMVGTLSMLLPSSFTDVASPQAAIAGDGMGRTILNFTLTLFGPIGNPTADVSYSADIKHGEVPAATLQALPVSPLDNYSFKAGSASYAAGSGSGRELTEGATQIDANVLKLRDGASQLVAGLLKLQAGATQLSNGLTTSAVPGAAKLADGANQLSGGTQKLADGALQARTGSQRLADGADQVATGSNKLSTGASSVASGSAQLSTALAQISGGLAQLADVSTGTPAALAGVKQILAAVDHPIGAGGVTDPGGLLQGIEQIGGGLAGVSTGLGQVSGGLGQLASSTTGLPAAKGGVDQIKQGLDPVVATGGNIDQLTGGTDQVRAGLDQALAAGSSIDQLQAAVTAARNSGGCDPTTCQPYLDGVLQGIAQLRTNTQQASAGLGLVSGGLGQLKTGLRTADGGLGQVSGGLATAVTGVGQLQAGVGQLQGGVGQLQAGNTQMQTAVQGQLIPGLQQLVTGLTQAVSGVFALNDGAAQASTGSVKLAAGAGQVAGGAKQLQSGAQQLSTGTNQLSTGLGAVSDGASQVNGGAGQVADGANQLSSGLNTAADGSKTLANGLTTAATGGQALPNGADQLSQQGTSKLVASGKETASSYGLQYAELAAGAKRAQTEGMAYGAPANAAGSTAYSIEIAAATNESAKNWGRGLVALLLFALTAGAGVLLQRRRMRA